MIMKACWLITRAKRFEIDEIETNYSNKIKTDDFEECINDNQ